MATVFQKPSSTHLAPPVPRAALSLASTTVDVSSPIKHIPLCFEATKLHLGAGWTLLVPLIHSLFLLLLLEKKDGQFLMLFSRDSLWSPYFWS